MTRLLWRAHRITMLLVAVATILSACGLPKVLLDNLAPPAEPVSGGLPAELTALVLAWKTTTATRYDAPPAAGAEGTIYTSTPHEVIALDAASGQVRWTAPIKYGAQQRLLVVAGDSVYTTSSVRTELVSLRADDGQVRWRVRLSDILVSDPQNVFVNDVAATERYTLITMTTLRTTRVVCLDATNGRLVWVTPSETPWYLGGAGWAILSDTHALIIRSSGWLELDISSGEIVHSAQGDIAIYRGAPYYALTTLYTAGQPIQALDMTTLKERWRFSDSCYEWNVLQRVVSVSDGIVYAFSTCNRLVALAETDGRVLWSFVPPRGERVLSFALFEGHGYLLTTGFMLYQFAPQTGAISGRLALSSNTLPLLSSGGVYATPQLLLVQLNQVQLLAFRELESVSVGPRSS